MKEQGFDNNRENLFRVCHPLFSKTPIDYFDYQRIYDNGELLRICTIPGFIEQYSIENLSPSMQELDFFANSGMKYAMLSSAVDLPPGAEFNQNKYKMNITFAADYSIHHRLYIVKRDHDHYKIYGFGTLNNKHSVFNFYLNASHLLDQFTRGFEKWGRQIIQNELDDRRIIIPDYLKKVDNDVESTYQYDLLSIKELTLSEEGKKLSPREWECISFLSKGYTMKMIGRELQISPRTVEQHIRNIKEKSGAHNKKALLSLLTE